MHFIGRDLLSIWKAIISDNPLEGTVKYFLLFLNRKDVNWMCIHSTMGQDQNSKW